MNYDSYVIGDGHTDERLKLKLWEENGLKDSVTGARFANAPQCCQHTSCDKCEICYKIVLSWHDAWMSFTSSDNSRGNAYLILLYNNYQKNPSWSYPSKCCRSVSKSRPHDTYQGMFWHVYTDHGMEQEDYMEKYEIAKHGTHKCRNCKNSVSQKLQSLQWHFEKFECGQSNMSLEEYYQKFKVRIQHLQMRRWNANAMNAMLKYQCKYRCRICKDLLVT